MKGKTDTHSCGNHYIALSLCSVFPVKHMPTDTLADLESRQSREQSSKYVGYWQIIWLVLFLSRGSAY